jgi:O-methyltransferase
MEGFRVTDVDSGRARYLDLVKRSVMDALYSPQEAAARSRPPVHGPGWPSRAHTMVSFERLDNLQACVERVVHDDVPGDLMETGVWRGGVTIFMRALLAAYDVRDRVVWVADSFAGLPPPSPRYPADAGYNLHEYTELAVPLDEVQANFRSYGLLDDQVRFLPGWFSDTLPQAPIQRLAVLRLDGDLYESTMDALTHLYRRLSPGGFLIVDDYGVVPPCKTAVDDFRTRHGIAEPIQEVDWTGIYWRKTAGL